MIERKLRLASDAIVQRSRAVRPAHVQRRPLFADLWNEGKPRFVGAVDTDDKVVRFVDDEWGAHARRLYEQGRLEFVPSTKNPLAMDAVLKS
jgi:hypothetical protein